MIRTIRWIACLAMSLMAINAADAQLERMKSSYDKAVETAQEKYTQRREKLEQELKTEKDKQFAILMTAYNDAIKRTTQKGDLEQANALLAERKQYEADHADESPRSAISADKKDTSREAPKTSVLPPILLICRLVEIRKPNADSNTLRSFTFEADGTAWMTTTSTARNGEQRSSRRRLPCAIKGNKLVIDATYQSSSSSYQRWIDIPLPLANPTIAYERNESKSYSHTYDLRLAVEKREPTGKQPGSSTSEDEDK